MPFHEIDLVDAVANDKPTVLLISTPGFCQTDICGPVLDLLIDEAGDRTDLNVIHAEVYINPSDFATGGFPELTPAVNAMALPFEPAIFVAAADNSIRARLDTTFDRSELRARSRSSDQRSKTTTPRRSRAFVRAVARSPESGSAERLATAAGALGVGVVDREAGVLEAVLVVEGCTLEQLGRLGIDDDVDATEVLGDVVGGAIGVEVHLVGEARAAPGRTAAQGESVFTSALMSSLTFEAALSVSMIMVGSS